MKNSCRMGVPDGLPFVMTFAAYPGEAIKILENRL
jgi:hypothetical protein